MRATQASRPGKFSIATLRSSRWFQALRLKEQGRAFSKREGAHVCRACCFLFVVEQIGHRADAAVARVIQAGQPKHRVERLQQREMRVEHLALYAVPAVV